MPVTYYTEDDLNILRKDKFLLGIFWILTAILGNLAAFFFLIVLSLCHIDTLSGEDCLWGAERRFEFRIRAGNFCFRAASEFSEAGLMARR
jgi:hypothetical protein